MEQLSSYDSRKLEEYRQSVEYLELCKQTLEEEEDVLNTAQASLEKEQQAVNTLISEKEQQMHGEKGRFITAKRQRRQSDVRKYMGPAMEEMEKVCIARYEQFGAAGHADKIKAIQPK